MIGLAHAHDHNAAEVGRIPGQTADPQVLVHHGASVEDASIAQASLWLTSDAVDSIEVFANPDEVPIWHRVMLGDAVDVEALLADLNKAKPSSAKGIYMKKVSVSTTMGPGLQVDQASLGL